MKPKDFLCAWARVSVRKITRLPFSASQGPGVRASSCCILRGWIWLLKFVEHEISQPLGPRTLFLCRELVDLLHVRLVERERQERGFLGSVLGHARDYYTTTKARQVLVDFEYRTGYCVGSIHGQPTRQAPRGVVLDRPMVRVQRLPPPNRSSWPLS